MDEDDGAAAGGRTAMVMVVGALVATSFGIMAGAVLWGWRNGTLRETPQERYDRQFEQIVSRLRASK